MITSGAGDGSSSQERGTGLEGGEQALWAQVSAEEPHAETVTVTLTQNPGEGKTYSIISFFFFQITHMCNQVFISYKYNIYKFLIFFIKIFIS